MRILHILDHSLPVQSGYVYRTLGLLGAQAALGWQTLQLTTPKQPPSRKLREAIDGWEYFRTPLRPSPLWMPKLASEYALVRATGRRLMEIACQWRPDVLHAHSPVVTALAALSIGRKLGIPVVYEVRAFWEDAGTCLGAWQANGLHYVVARRLETHALRNADVAVVISKGLYDEVRGRGIPEKDLFIVPNAVDLSEFEPDRGERSESFSSGAPARQPVVGFIGSFYAYEGLELLLEAAERTVEQRPDTKFILVGGGREEAHLRNLCKAGRMSDYVTLTGWVHHDRINELYRNIDILVYPRRRSRLTELVTPLKPLEAMAHGKIVLASDVGGHKELIEHGRNGFLFRADDVSDLVRQLIQLLDARAQWPEIGRSARKCVAAERNWQTVGSLYAEVYEAARSRRRRIEIADRCSRSAPTGRSTHRGAN